MAQMKVCVLLINQIPSSDHNDMNRKSKIIIQLPIVFLYFEVYRRSLNLFLRQKQQSTNHISKEVHTMYQNLYADELTYSFSVYPTTINFILMASSHKCFISLLKNFFLSFLSSLWSPKVYLNKHSAANHNTPIHADHNQHSILFILLNVRWQLEL